MAYVDNAAELAGRLQRRDQQEKNDHPVARDVGPDLCKCI
jgi:hypothetical protein